MKILYRNTLAGFLKSGFILLIFATACFSGLIRPAFAQSSIYKTLTISDGLPQTFVSQIVQDKQGFIWLATRNGLARYDGREFRVFRNDPEHPTGMTANILSDLFLDTKNRLWIAYEQGEIDIMDLSTEKITRLTADKRFGILRDKFKAGKSVIELSQDLFWLLGKDGRIYEVDFFNKKVQVKTAAMLSGDPACTYTTGISFSPKKQIVLVTNKALLYLDTLGKILKKAEFTFQKPDLFNPKRSWKDNSPFLRNNGQVLIPDEERLILYDEHRNIFEVIPLPPQQYYLVPARIMDAQENIYLGYEDNLFRLDNANKLSSYYKETATPDAKIRSMLMDDSGVLWVGTNGYGVRQFDTYLKPLPKLTYNGSFQKQVLEKLGVPEQDIKSTFLSNMSTYFFRWTKARDGRIWMTKAGADSVRKPNLVFFENQKLVSPNWKFTNSPNETGYGLNALAVSVSGKLWAIDHAFRPVYFDTKNYTATILPAIPHYFKSEKYNEINGFWIEGEDTFWISTMLGLIKYDRRANMVHHYFHTGPVRQLMSLAPDPYQQDILWIGTYSDGLIRFNKKTARYQVFTTKSGLPNNTVYAIQADQKGRLWCSTNKGIFSIHTSSTKVLSFTTSGEIPLDEFNRFHYFKFPDGTMTFGGTEAYTLFDPKDLFEDHYQPKIVLTGIKINNKKVADNDPDYGLPHAINNLTTLDLPYDKNFLVFEFAALQFNMTKKLHYRYKLVGLDEEWVNTDKDNSATYTTIPPGNYELMINASNTAGKWSSHIRTLSIIIHPPFWKTWWFLLACVLFLAAVLYFSIQKRISTIRKMAQQKIAFEREAIELEAQAMRSQMNPHFIFNCLNSIKALIQEDQKRKAVIYLTTFSKLIRNQLYNNQLEISLEDELQTCRQYLELEALRFGDKINYQFQIDSAADLRMTMVPPLILQPFVENAIIHGILPSHESGQIVIKVVQEAEQLICTIDDNGIGRQKADRDRKARHPGHVSKGTLLAESRLKMHNRLNRNSFNIEIIDKVKADQTPAGTCVKVIFKTTL